MDATDWISLATLLVAVAGILLVVRQLHEQKRSLRADFGNLYVQRYWQIEDDRILTPEDDRRRQLHDRRYLRLFEDEFEVASLGLLDLPQWAVWHGVLDEPRGIEEVSAALDQCDRKKAEFMLLRKCLAQRKREGRRHDISDCAAR